MCNPSTARPGCLLCGAEGSTGPVSLLVRKRRAWPLPLDVHRQAELDSEGRGPRGTLSGTDASDVGRIVNSEGPLWQRCWFPW